ncbi:type IV conjugative transfer system protein TraL [Photobacterium frigidiphilum]|uniref:Protein TraL n=1 Tax=Photobacterium frigidiphilum TaxID=264736 RepID=A0A2T3J5K3_9GAMM|nr:type IV conjugative transfer system protein TraL [Photobacterium frigidiphilum]PSU39913.1 type IV conjugative transfer system protein TraL [Photobacterium frigidiphilum]
MENPALFFSIPKQLSKGKTLLGFPRDELLPSLVIFGILFTGRHEAVGFILAAIWFIGLHSLKKTHGDNFIRLTLYWYAPDNLSAPLFNTTPSAEKRYWIH